MKRLLFLCACVLIPLVSRAQFSDLKTVEIGNLCTTHIIFTSDLTYVDVSKPDVIVAMIVDASKNMLAIKARAQFDFETTVSALEANGTMHTFRVKFNAYPKELVVDTRPNANVNSAVNTQVRPSSAVEQPGTATAASAVSVPAPVVVNEEMGTINVASAEASNFGKADAPTLEEIVRYPRELYHIGDRLYSLEVYVTNVFVYSDLIYIVIELRNNSDIGYESNEAQFTINTIGRKKELLVTNKTVSAKSTFGNLSCAPRNRTVVGYTIPKFTLLKNECLRIYVYETNGTRNLVLTLSDKDINYAVSPDVAKQKEKPSKKK